MRCASSGSPDANETTIASGSLPSSLNMNCLRTALTLECASMEFDRGGNAVGVEFGVRFRIVVNHDLAGLFLRTTGERFFAPALFASANVDLRRIGHQELHGLALGHLNHKPRL